MPILGRFVEFSVPILGGFNRFLVPILGRFDEFLVPILGRFIEFLVLILGNIRILVGCDMSIRSTAMPSGTWILFRSMH